MTLSDHKPNPSFIRWFAWGLCLLAAVPAVAGVVGGLFELIKGLIGPIQFLGNVLWTQFSLVFAVLAALVLTRQPGNTMGWLFALPSFAGATSLLSDYFTQNLIAPPAIPSPFFLFLIWIQNTFWTFFIFPILLTPLLFPTGRLLSRRWSWVLGLAAILLIYIFTVATFSSEVGLPDATWTVKNPIGFIDPEWVQAMFGIPWVVGLSSLTFSSMAALIVRYRRGSIVERTQIKWVVYASVFFGVGYISLLAISAGAATGLISDLVNLFLGLILFIFPVSIGFAILHYRLWDIDFVINRSLVYGALTVLLAILFGASLWIINSLFQNHAGGPLVAVAISAAGFGALFQPARRWLQRFVDRRFYNIQIDYNKTPLPVAVTNVISPAGFGGYQNLEFIGRGGMAEVYKSTHPTLGIPVAIKVLPSNLAGDPDFRKRFAREAQTVKKLEHPHIIRVFDSGETNGTYYMAMEYIPGKDMGQYLAGKGHLPLAEALPILKGIAAALDYAHAQGFVHRDIKPSNVLLDVTQTNLTSNAAGYRAVLTDFGIAKILGNVTRYTETGAMLGTLDYIAPEQIQAVADIDGRADVYSFGVMVFQTLTGSLPFQHNNPGALLMAHMLQPPPDPREHMPDFSDQVAYAIQRALAKKPEDRFVTAGEFINSLI